MPGPVEPRLLKRAGATRNYLIALVLVGILTSELVIAQAWLLARAVAIVLTYRALPGNWLPTLVLLLAIFAARGLLAWVNSVLVHRSAAAVKSWFRHNVLAAYLIRPVASSATLTKVATTGLDALDGYLSKYLSQLGLAASVPLLVGGVLLLADWPSALIVAFTLPLVPVLVALVGWTTQAAIRHAFTRADKLANHFADLIQGLPTFQAFTRARAQRRGLEITEEQFRGQTIKVLYIAFLSSFALELLAPLSVALVVVTVGSRLAGGKMPFETALFMLILAPEAFLPVRQVGIYSHDSADDVAAANATLDLIELGDESGGGGLPEGSRLTLDEVTFTWPGTTTPAVAGLSLGVPEGRVVTLTGASGDGKSTALGLVTDFRRPDSGRVPVDGTDLTGLDVTRWRARTAWVGQNPDMVTGTVGDSVALGHPGVPDAKLLAALRDARTDFSLCKPVGDDSEGLLAGERRRVALARALIWIWHGGARLLILDEPTAGLDADVEVAVIRAVRDSGADALVVSHHSAVLAAADKVVAPRGGCSRT